jgi:large conductance mechanosensitive channel
MLKEFRNFLLRGNVLELAIAFVLGVAFTAVVSSFVTNLLTPLIAIPGTADFSDLDFTISNSTFSYGQFINDALAFLLIGAAIFFFVIKPIDALMARRKTQSDVDAPTKECPECLSNIPTGAKRCAFCTAQIV